MRYPSCHDIISDFSSTAYQTLNTIHHVYFGFVWPRTNGRHNSKKKI